MKHGLATALPSIDPIVQPVPDLHYSTFMGMLFELKVGDGRLMVCGLNLSDRTKPEVNAMRASILSYMESNDFNPTVSIEAEKFKEVFCGMIAKGDFGSASISVRKIYQLCMNYGAVGAVIAHNHPSGLSLPSAEDYRLTVQLKQNLKHIQVELIVHYIIADNDAVSMRESGALD